ncbi:ABC transporter ATP-binding protein [Rhodococcus aerolatus]
MSEDRTSVLVTRGLTKRYGRVTAVSGVDLDVRRGDVFGFLGANGSGKTTTVRMLLGLVLATSGSIELLGEPMPKRRRSVLPRVGALIEGPAHQDRLSGRANLLALDAAGPGSGRGRRARVDTVLEQVGLGEVGRRPVGKYSLGMRQRLGLAGALLRAPDLLVLDEPTNGLDPQGIREIRDLLLELNAAGTTIFLSSHLLAEVEQLCTRVAVLDGGRLVLQDDLEALRRPTGRVLVDTPDPARAVAELAGWDGVDVADREGSRLVVTGRAPSEVASRLVGRGVRLSGLAEERRSLEETVLAATVRGSGDRARPVGRGAR